MTPPPTEIDRPGPEADWRAHVEAELGGPDAFATALVTRTLEGLDVEPLYGARPAVEPVPARASGDWVIASEVAHPSPAVANERALHELENGATGLFLVLDPAGARASGVRAASLHELDRALRGVWLDAAPVAVASHADGAAVLGTFEALARERGLAPAALELHAGFDPFAMLARDGALPGDLDDARRELVLVAEHSRAALARTRSLAVDATVWHRAGADAAEELALAAAAFAEGLRWLEAGGLTPAAVHGEYVWRFDVGRDVFGEVAKLRAARVLHARILGASGVAEATPLVLHAFTSPRGATAGDPWTDMLRGTLGATAAALGSADLVTVTPFDAPAPESAEGREASSIGRRVARNTQLVLQRECGLARVSDPTAGSAYVETRTDQLARLAWERFVEIERAGGLAEALRTGLVAERIGAQRARLAEAVRSGARPLVGGTHYPPPADAKHPTAAPLEGLKGIADERQARLASRGRIALGPVESMPHAVAAAARGATFDEIGGALVRGAPLARPPFEPIREESFAAPPEVSA